MTTTLAPAPDYASTATIGELAQNAEPTKGFPKVIAPGTIAEPKYDGWRLLAIVGAGKVDFFSRGGNKYNVLPKIEAELLSVFPEGSVLDGEAVALRIENGIIINDWGSTQSILSKVSPGAAADKISYMVFDLIAHRYIDARPLEFAQRRALLEKIFDQHKDSFEAVVLTAQMEPTEANYNAAVTQGFEGVILKRLNAPYASNKRGYGWKKVKPTTSIDAVIMGFTPSKTGTGLIGSIIFGQNDELTGTLVVRGRCSGMKMKERVAMTKNPDAYIGKVIEIAHEGFDISENGDDGGFRFPRFKRFRPDRSPESVEFHNV